MLWTGFSDSRSLGRRSACPKVSRPRSIWRLLSASRLSGYSAASYRNKMHRRAAAILRALPLHHSQEETEQHDGWSLFGYYLAPTNEFYRKYLHPGNSWRSSRPKRFGRNMRPSSKRCSDSTANFEFFFINKSHCAWIRRSGVLCLSPKAIFEQTATAPKGERCTDV